MAERMPLPHFITARGDSTRLVRKIHLLLNYTHVQNFDSITSLLKKFMLAAGRPGGAEARRAGHVAAVNVNPVATGASQPK
jgi:hypothetical protein